jgi:hypothetical protein
MLPVCVSIWNNLKILMGSIRDLFLYFWDFRYSDFSVLGFALVSTFSLTIGLFDDQACCEAYYSCWNWSFTVMRVVGEDPLIQSQHLHCVFLVWYLIIIPSFFQYIIVLLYSESSRMIDLILLLIVIVWLVVCTSCSISLYFPLIDV